MIAKQTAKQNGGQQPSRRQWTAPCYFDINVGELNPDFGEALSEQSRMQHACLLVAGNMMAP